MYNEQPHVIQQTLALLGQTGVKVLVVDDGSSPALGNDLGSGVLLLRHSVNLGQGAALQTGMTFARVQPDVDFVVHFDADGQHAAESIEDLLAPLRDGSADIVFGSRFMRHADSQLIPRLRSYTLRLGRIFNRVITGVSMTDAHVGLRAMNRRAFERISLRENRMAYATELLWQIRQHDLRWREVPVRITYTPYSRKKGQSSWNAIRIAGDVLLRLIYR